MRALAGELLLAAWEEGASRHELRRPLAMLSAALPDSDPVQLGALPIAERNLMLLHLHRLSFGSLLRVFGSCPECSARLEFAVPVAEMAAHVEGQYAAELVTWTQDGRQYRLRAVSSDDLIATLDAPDLGAAQEMLLARCLEITPPASTPTAPASPAVLRRFGQLHAATELTCAIECPSCARREVLDFDIARFLWAEVQHAARRLLGEIHELASAYGWSQQAIVTMSAARRRAYLELLST